MLWKENKNENEFIFAFFPKISSEIVKHRKIGNKIRFCNKLHEVLEQILVNFSEFPDSCHFLLLG